MDQAELARWNRATELLDRILELPTDQRQSAIEALGKQYEVHLELTSLYNSTEEESVLDASLDSVLEQVQDAIPERNAFKGQVLDNWQLGDEIGHGGMSVVYHATRTGQDFQQKAALKILSLTHFGDDFVASFVRERQILSDLHHPGISRLIDGGITPDGAPFLVMQYVSGETIDRWCEQRGADLKTITRLMLKLCHAVAYAQRFLVIHQDIKPANVLVDEHDQPVLIDFGIAAVLSQSSESRSLQAFTPTYAAPEQLSGGAITTATDVYAFGMLFRSLVGERPLDRDLNAILDAATREDPEQRYANARNLAEDLQAWLEQRPVRARPPYIGYRTSRFIVRNLWGVVAAALVVISLLAGTGAAMWQARIASAERDVAQAESARATQAVEFLKELFRASDPDRSRGEVVSARELLDQGAHQVRNAMQDSPALQAEMLVLLGDLYRELGETAAAGPLLEDGMRIADEVGELVLRVSARRGLALQIIETGAHDEALALAEQGEQLLLESNAVPGEQHATLLQPILSSLAELGRVPEAVERGRSALTLVRESPSLSEVAIYNYLFSVGNVLLIAEQADEAAKLLLEAEEIGQKTNSSLSMQLELQSNLAGVLGRRGDYEAALSHRRQVMTLVEEIYPRIHPERARMLSNLAATLNALGLHQEAEGTLREALEVYEQIYQGAPNPRVAAAHNNLGRALEQAGNYTAAKPHLLRAWELAAQLFGENDPRYLIATGNLGSLYRQLGEFGRAEELLLKTLELRRSIFGEDHPAVGSGLGLLCALRLDQSRWTDTLNLCDEALALFGRINYTNPRSLVTLVTRRAQALAGLGRVSDAEAAFAEARQLSDEAGADAGLALPNLLAAYAQFLVDRAEPGADAAIDEATSVHREMLGEDHPSTLRMLELPGYD